MTSFFIRLIVNACALLAIANLSGNAIVVKGFGAALIAALVLGLANALVKPILYGMAKTMTCALSCLTLGLWSLFLSWLINGALFWVVGQNLSGFHVKNFSTAMWGALALSLVNAIVTVITSPEKDRDNRE